MKGKTLHLIGNAHIDPVWLWNWQEGYHEVLATFRSALARMLEFDDFVFTSSSVAFLEWVEQTDLDLFNQIQQRVAEGRWCLVGGWWIEPDCNIPGGESFVRHGLYGQRYLREKFGGFTRVGYNVDSFGHAGSLPQILKKSGMDYYVFMRPGPHEKDLPGRLFWWKSPDGSRLLAFQIPYTYGFGGSAVEELIHNYADDLREPHRTLMSFYGVGDHGGGPTIEQIRRFHELQRDDTLPELVFSSPERYFNELKTEELPIPEVLDDLQHHASGCYAAHSGIKQWNRKAEHALMAAEKLCTAANGWTGKPYPGYFEHAWKNVLFNQFHDILAGTSLEAAYESARDQLGEAASIAARNQNQALQSIAWQIDIQEEQAMQPIIVFNPHPWAARMSVELEMAGQPKDNQTLMDAQDHPVPMQWVQSAVTTNFRCRLAFTADLPALGYQVFRLVEREGKREGLLSASAQKTNTDRVIENAYFRLEIDPQTGCIANLYDKRVDRVVFKGQAARPVVIDDPSDTWSHNVFRFDQVCGSFTPQKVQLVESGEVKEVLRVEYSYRSSHLTQDFILYHGLPRIDVRVSVDWHEQFKILKLRFPLDLLEPHIRYDIPYGMIERPGNAEEEPGQSWIDISGIARSSGADYGVGLINDAKYSYDVDGQDIGLTVLRSPIYANHMPKLPEAGRDYRFIDQGYQTFTYSLLPHDCSWQDSRVVRQAWELNQPAAAMNATYHTGSLPQKASFLIVDGDNIVVSVLKKAEDGFGWVMRAYETTGKICQAVFHAPVWGRDFQAAFEPYEIKTFLIPVDGSKTVYETNLLEEAL